jgi:hypothetical protein
MVSQAVAFNMFLAFLENLAPIPFISQGAARRWAMGNLATSLYSGWKIDVSRDLKGSMRKPKTGWRRRWDSNPRDPFGPNGFQDRRLQPLGHPSGIKFVQTL